MPGTGSIYTTDTLINELLQIRERGWIEITRNRKNAGRIGNTLEDLLGIQENNLPIANAAEWELKTQRINTNSLVTLFHMEPSPRALHIVPYLLSNFGWRHEQAGKRYPDNEKSFRQTLSYQNPTIRGFDLDIDEVNRRIIIKFDINLISQQLNDWKNELIINNNITIDKNHTPYWGYNDIFHTAGTKLKNCFFVLANTRRENNREMVRYERIMMLSNFCMDRMIDAIRNRQIYVDIDARTGHNHGTKFRIRPDSFQNLYENIRVL